MMNYIQHHTAEELRKPIIVSVLGKVLKKNIT